MNGNKLLTTLMSRRTSFRTAFMIIIAFAAMAATTQSAFAHEGFVEICKFGDIDGKDGEVDSVKFSIKDRYDSTVVDNIWVKVGTCTPPIKIPVVENGPFTIKEEVDDPQLSGISVLPPDQFVSSNLAGGSVTVNVRAGDITKETLVIFRNLKKNVGLIKICKLFEDDKKDGEVGFDVTWSGGKEHFKVPVGKCILLPIKFPKDTDVTVQEQVPEGTEVNSIEVHSSNPSTIDKASGKVIVKIGDLITVIIIINKDGKVPPPPPKECDCTFTIGGYSGPHAVARITEAITGTITIAGVTFNEAVPGDITALINILNTGPGDGCQERQLLRQLVAAKLNLARGACPTGAQAAAIAQAEALLTGHITKAGVPDDFCGDLGDIGTLISNVTSFNQSNVCP